MGSIRLPYSLEIDPDYKDPFAPRRHIYSLPNLDEGHVSAQSGFKKSEE